MDDSAGQRKFGANGKIPWNDREIEEALSEPTPEVIDAVKHLDGDHTILGASGKMGVTLAAMIRRALDAAGMNRTRVTGVARFRDAGSRAALEAFGVETIQCDLGDYDAVMNLPLAANLQYLSGQKFGTDGHPDETWVQNTVAPSNVARRFRESRIVVFSTGCVYPLSPTSGPGANECSPLGFIGEYAATCIGRERVFSYYSRTFGTKAILFRLNYSVEFRYGVLAEIGDQVRSGRPVNVTVPVANVIWQRDACARAVQSLLHVESPPRKLNITGAEKIDIIAVAKRFGVLFGRKPCFQGKPQPAVWHADASKSIGLYGPTLVSLDTMIEGVGRYLAANGKLLGKPTHFEAVDGKF